MNRILVNTWGTELLSEIICLSNFDNACMSVSFGNVCYKVDKPILLVNEHRNNIQIIIHFNKYFTFDPLNDLF